MLHRPSFGRPRKVRGLDQFDTPPVALDPLFEHEPLLAGVTRVCEPFCGKGNLVVAMRARGLTVHATDIQHRGCPDSTTLDFKEMTERPCDVLISNPPFASAMEFIERALMLRFRVVALLLKQSFLSTSDRFERLHKPGHLCRVHILAERLQGMHDIRHLAAGGKESSQSQVHAWFVFDQNHYGPATINPVSICKPAERMPWSCDNGHGYHKAPIATDHGNGYHKAPAAPDNGRGYHGVQAARDNGRGYHGPRGTSRGYVLARLARDGRSDLTALVEAGGLSVRAALRQLRAAE